MRRVHKGGPCAQAVACCLQATIAYYLVLDNKKRINTDSYLRDELTEAHDADHQYPSGTPQELCSIFYIQQPACAAENFELSVQCGDRR